ncbi:DUF2934 domain-containing protein [Methylotenera sp.]|uniref:DUF2934 domain-containing protein n=1 Tax=Methylotenera sp. TaxID=2051956 RepID=UPI00248708AD|nr:DUF2934 domain-containing protein [Methylotenera sp.]MDI1361793.1 DUF2934 domain-containing protein [Methylotenera sp.]
MRSSKVSKTIPSDTKNSMTDKPKKLSKEQIFSRIAVSAYYKAEARGYEPGHEIQDWLEAEAEIKKQK